MNENVIGFPSAGIPTEAKRWRVEAWFEEEYRSDEIEELSEINDLVEGWPDWTKLIEPIKITYLC